MEDGPPKGELVSGIDSHIFGPTGEWESEHTTLSALFKIRDSRLTGPDRHVLIALILRSKPTLEGWLCWPSLATLSTDASVSKSTLLVTIGRLKAWGFIDWEPGGPRSANTYEIDMEVVHRLLDRRKKR